jgi:hypothetical protein
LSGGFGEMVDDVAIMCLPCYLFRNVATLLVAD